MADDRRVLDLNSKIHQQGGLEFRQVHIRIVNNGFMLVYEDVEGHEYEIVYEYAAGAQTDMLWDLADALGISESE